jgi:hypothetical protein
MGRKEVEVVLKGKDEGASSAVDRLAQRLKMMRKENAMAGENVLERAMGSGRGMANAGMDLLGLGAAGIITDQLGQRLANLTSKAIELRDAYRQGKMTLGEMADELGKQAPLLGGIWATGRNIRELLTNEKAEIEGINRETTLTNQILDAQLKSRKAIKEVMAEIAQQERKHQLRGTNTGLDPDQQELNNLNEGLRSRGEGLKDRQDDAASKTTKDLDAQIAAQREKLLAAQNSRIAFEDNMGSQADALRSGKGQVEGGEETRRKYRNLKAAEEGEAAVLKEMAAKRAAAAKDARDGVARVDVAADEADQKRIAEVRKKQLQEQLKTEDDARKAYIRDRAASFHVGPFEDPAAAEEREREEQEAERWARGIQRENRQTELDAEIEAKEEEIDKLRDGMSAGSRRGGRFSATLLSDRYRDVSGTFEDKQQAAIQKNTAAATVTLNKMLEELKGLRKQRAGRDVNA